MNPVDNKKFHLTPLQIEFGGLIVIFGAAALSYMATGNAIVGFLVGLAIFLYLVVILARVE